MLVTLPDVSGFITTAQTNIRAARLAKNMSTHELARKAGCTAPQVSNVEAGRTPGSVILLLRLGAVLGMHPSELFSELPEESEPWVLM